MRSTRPPVRTAGLRPSAGSAAGPPRSEAGRWRGRIGIYHQGMEPPEPHLRPVDGLRRAFDAYLALPRPQRAPVPRRSASDRPGPALRVRVRPLTGHHLALAVGEALGDWHAVAYAAARLRRRAPPRRCPVRRASRAGRSPRPCRGRASLPEGLDAYEHVGTCRDLMAVPPAPQRDIPRWGRSRRTPRGPGRAGLSREGRRCGGRGGVRPRRGGSCRPRSRCGSAPRGR